MKVPVVPSASDYRKRLAQEYANLLLVDGKSFPDPFSDQLKDGWEDEQTAMKIKNEKWPPTMYADMVEYMHEWLVAFGQE